MGLMGSGCYVVVCCSINIVRVFIVVDTVTEMTSSFSTDAIIPQKSNRQVNYDD